MRPESRLCDRDSDIKLSLTSIPLGRFPVNPLPERCRVLSLGRLNRHGGIEPLKSGDSRYALEMPGIKYRRQFEAVLSPSIASVVKFLALHISAGKVPSKQLLTATKSVSLGREKSSPGISPVIWFPLTWIVDKNFCIVLLNRSVSGPVM